MLCNIVPFLGEEKLACTILEQLTKVERFDMVLLFLSAEEKNGKDVEGFLFLLWPIFFSFLFVSTAQQALLGALLALFGDANERTRNRTCRFCLHSRVSRVASNTSLTPVVLATFCCNSSSKHSHSSLLVS